MERQGIDPRFGRGVHQLAIAAWAKEWNERSNRLPELIAGMEGDGLEFATELLREIRECRGRLAEPPDPGLRSLWHRALDETWEAACSMLYGDLVPARRHADDALHYLQEIRTVLETPAASGRRVIR